jgi:hypothetical protein
MWISNYLTFPVPNQELRFQYALRYAERPMGHARAVGKLVGLCAAIIAVIALVEVCVDGPLTAKVWHLTHADAFQCSRSIRVSVPDGWYPDSIERGCQLLRPTYSLPIQHQFLHPARIFINVVDTPTVGDDDWRQDVIARLRREGKNVQGVTTRAVGGIPTVCFEWDSAENSSYSDVACNVDKRMVINFFNFTEQWAPDFDEILGSIQVIPIGTAESPHPLS